MFAGKVVIVTGASSGIGEATAIEFAKNGARLTLVGRNKEKLDECAQACKNANGEEAHIITADLSVEEQARTVVPETIKRWGHLDVLVNNAGKINHDSILNKEFMPVLTDILQLNLFSTVILSNDAAPHLVKTKGNIVNVSSIAALSAFPGSTSYCMSKAAMDQFTKCIAAELASKGVRVNSVNPGPVRTNILTASGKTAEQTKAVWEDFTKKMPLQRVAESHEIADLIVFLASEKAKSLTGSIFVSDCGAMIRGNTL